MTLFSSVDLNWAALRLALTLRTRTSHLPRTTRRTRLLVRVAGSRTPTTEFYCERAVDRNRTRDILFTREALYRLSYNGVSKNLMCVQGEGWQPALYAVVVCAPTNVGLTAPRSAAHRAPVSESAPLLPVCDALSE